MGSRSRGSHVVVVVVVTVTAVVEIATEPTARVPVVVVAALPHPDVRTSVDVATSERVVTIRVSPAGRSAHQGPRTLVVTSTDHDDRVMGHAPDSVVARWHDASTDEMGGDSSMDQTWTINYLPGEGRLTGKLHVRDDEVAFEALYDSSFKSVAKNIGLATGALAASGGHLAYLRDNGVEAEVVIPSGSIAEVRPAKKGLMKRVVIELTDGSEHTFEYGMLPVTKLVDAVSEVATH